MMQPSPPMFATDLRILSRQSSRSLPNDDLIDDFDDSSSSSDVTIKADASPDWWHHDDTHNELHHDRSSDCSWGGWSSAGGYDEFDRKACEEVNACLLSIDKLLYEGVLDGNANSEITQECQLWIQNSDHLRVHGKRIGPPDNWEGFDYYSPPQTSRVPPAPPPEPLSESLEISGLKILPKVGPVRHPMVDEIIAIDGIVEELIAKDEICEKEQKDENRPKVNSNHAVDSVIDQLFDIEWMEVTEKMSSLVETYRSSSDLWRSQSDGLIMSSSEGSSEVTPIPDLDDRINPRTDSLNRFPPLSQLNSSRLDYNKPFTRENKFRDFEPERKMRRNNWENRTFSRGSAESKYYHEQVIADLTQMVNKSISVKPIESRTLEARTYTTLGTESLDRAIDPFNLRPISMSTTRLYQSNRPATTQNQDFRRGEIRRGKIKKGKLEPLDNRSKTPGVPTSLANEGLFGTSLNPTKSNSLLDRMSPIGAISYNRLPPITLDEIQEERFPGIKESHLSLPDRRPEMIQRPITADSRTGQSAHGQSAHGRRPLSIVSQITALRSSKNILKGITGHAPPTYKKNYV